MKLTKIIAHLSFPALLTFYTLFEQVRREPLSLEIANVVSFSFFFYGMPYFLWLIISRLAGLSNIFWHAGLLAASTALITTFILSYLGPHDPSGLPYEWLLYWPLAVILQTAFVISIFLYRRFHV